MELVDRSIRIGSGTRRSCHKGVLSQSDSLADGVAAAVGRHVEKCFSESRVDALVPVRIYRAGSSEESYGTAALVEQRGLADVVFLTIEWHNVT